MYAYGIRGNAFKLLKSYLTDRTQYVVYDSKQSETLPIKCGVPQGSILGPLLFICVMNDIGNVSDFLYTILYADDTSVLLNGKCYTDLVALLIPNSKNYLFGSNPISYFSMFRKPTTLYFT